MNAQQQRWVLSGGLASGKSQVRALLAEHGCYTIDADSIGHEVLASEGPAFEEVRRRWPKVVKNGEVDRRALAEIVFNDRRELSVLEAITHPLIFDRIRARVKDVEGVVVVEIPVLEHILGSAWRRIVVDARYEISLQRAVERGMSEADARSIMTMQPSREEWLAMADLVIPNNGTLEELDKTIDTLLDHGRL